jgi:uncharacterized protein
MLVRLARMTIEKLIDVSEVSRIGQEGEGLLKVVPEKPPSAEFKVKRGVFVTIKNREDRSLRGCIGFISPTPLWDAVQSAAALAAFEDPRFPPLGKDEMDKVVLEVSVMSEPSMLAGSGRESYEADIHIGQDGLIIFNHSSSGLLLPQVPIEENWDAGEFLDALCMKAGLRPETLEEKDTKIMRFQCQVFEELSPNGKVVEKDMRPKMGKSS